MNLIFFLLEEWNNSAVAAIFAVLLFATLVPFFLLLGILKSIPESNRFLKKLQLKNKWLYSVFLLLLLLVSATLVYLFLLYWNGL
jgi:hypothetical protein